MIAKSSFGSCAQVVVDLNVFLDRLATTTIAFFEVEDSLLDHILVGRMSSSAS